MAAPHGVVLRCQFMIITRDDVPVGGILGIGNWYNDLKYSAILFLNRE
jgi:hypothetical protein